MAVQFKFMPLVFFMKLGSFYNVSKPFHVIQLYSYVINIKLKYLSILYQSENSNIAQHQEVWKVGELNFSCMIVSDKDIS